MKLGTCDLRNPFSIDLTEFEWMKMDVQFSDFLNHAKKSKAELSLKKMLYNLTVFFWKMYRVEIMNKTKAYCLPSKFKN